MGSLHVVLVKPSLRRFASLADRLEKPSVQATIPEDRIEALVVTVLPRTAWLDEPDSDAPLLDPLLHLLRYEFRAVVALDRRRYPVELDELLEHANDIDRGQVPRALDPQRTARVLVDHRQEPKRSSIRRLVGDEVVAPDVVGADRLLRNPAYWFRAADASGPSAAPG